MSKDDLNRLSSDEAMLAASNTRRAVEPYLKQMGVPEKYVDRMFSISKDQLDWISEEDFGADFHGFITDLKDWVDAQCDKRTDTEKRIYEEFKDMEIAQQPEVTMREILHKHEDQLECEREVRNKLALIAYGNEVTLEQKNSDALILEYLEKHPYPSR